jgi:hypothetical protein
MYVQNLVHRFFESFTRYKHVWERVSTHDIGFASIRKQIVDLLAYIRKEGAFAKLLNIISRWKR